MKTQTILHVPRLRRKKKKKEKKKKKKNMRTFGQPLHRVREEYKYSGGENSLQNSFRRGEKKGVCKGEMGRRGLWKRAYGPDKKKKKGKEIRLQKADKKEG